MITPDRIVSTTCPYCGVGCNLELHIKDDYVYKVTSPFDGVVNHGNLCVKGRFGYDFIYNKDRVTTPLIRKAAQAPGARTQAFDRDQWREVSWDEALDYTADRLIEIYQRDGADAMAVYCCAKATNEDNYLLQKLFRALFLTNNVDHCTRLCHAGSVVALQMAIGSSAMSNTAAEVIHSDVFLVTGSNTAETHPIIALQMKAAVANHGAKLIVVDPRRVEMVNWAALWLPEKPGTDVPLFSAMAHVIIKERLYNQDFVERRTEGFEEFSKSMEKFTPAYAEAISGVDRNLIVEAARMYATAKNAGDLLGARHSRTLARHRQRHVPHPPGAPHRPHRPQRHGSQSAEGPKQRAGRVGFRRHAMALSGLSARRRRSDGAEIRTGVEERAGRAEPQAGADDNRDHERGRTGRGVRSSHHG